MTSTIQQLRKQRDTLRIAGLGVFAFGLWSVVRTILHAVFGISDVRRVLIESNLQVEAIWALYAVVGAVLAIDLGLRVYVTWQAQRESAGKHSGVPYLVVTGLLALSHLVLLPMDVIQLARNADPLLEIFATLFIEITSLLTLCGVLWSAIRVRRLQKSLQGEESA